MKRNEFIKASAGIILSSSIMTGSYAQDLTQTIGTEKSNPFDFSLVTSLQLQRLQAQFGIRNILRK